MADAGNLVVTISGDTSKLTSALVSAGAQVQAFSGTTSSATKGVDSFKASMLGVIAAMGTLYLVGNQAKQMLSESLTQYEESENAQAQLAAVLESTGHQAGVTAQSAIDLADSLQEVTKFSNNTIQAGENMLLMYTNISKDIFPQATETVLNFAQALGTDVPSAAKMVGRALNDPVQGLTLLTRAGIQFTQQQKDQYQALVDSGQGAKAQALILQELAKKTGDAAKVAGLTFSGQLAIMKNHLDDSKKSVGLLIAGGLQPLIQKLNEFISHNQGLVASLLAAAGAIGVVALAIAGLAAVMLVAQTAAAPFLLAFLAIASVVGVVAFMAFQKFQQKIGSLSSYFKSATGDMAGAASKNFGATGQAAQATTDSMRKLNDQIAQNNEDFQQSLAETVARTKKSITDLKGQIGDETKAFDQANQDRTETFQQNQDDMAAAHKDKTDDIKSQLQEEVNKGFFADQTKITSLQAALAKEDDSYNTQTARNLAQYDKETEKAKEEHDKRLSALEDSLKEQTTLLERHADEVKAVQGLQLQDEIDKINQSHDRAIAAFEDQKNQIIKSGQQTADGYSDAINGILPSIDLEGMKAKATELGTTIGGAIEQALQDALKQMAVNSWNALVQFVKDLIRLITGVGSNPGLQNSTQSTKSGTNPYGLATGGPVQSGLSYLVGEKGPEMFVPSQGGTIVPNGKSVGSNVSINVSGTFNMGSNFDVDQFAQRLGQQIKMANLGV